ncbi:MAG: PilN domain-containing protein [Thalassolituus sp.]
MSWDIKQQINFYLEEFQPPKIPQDLRLILIGAGLHAVLIVLVIAGLAINFVWQGHRLKNVTQQHVIVEQQVANIERERPPLQRDQSLVDERSRLREELESSQRILRYLTQQELESSHSFTTMVQQLGEQNVSGVWLKRFSFDDEGNDISLEGYTDDPAKISRYVTSLLARDGYRDHAFRSVDVQRDEDGRWLQFRLDSRPVKKEKSAETQRTALTSREVMRQLREGR